LGVDREEEAVDIDVDHRHGVLMLTHWAAWSATEK